MCAQSLVVASPGRLRVRWRTWRTSKGVRGELDVSVCASGRRGWKKGRISMGVVLVIPATLMAG